MSRGLGGERVSELEVRGSLGALAAEWGELADRAGVPPFLRPGWIEAWWRAFGTAALTLLLVRRGDRLVGVLPLIRRSGRVSSPTNWHTPVFGPVVEDEAALETLCRAIFEGRPRHIRLGFLDSGQPAVSSFAAAAASHRHGTLIRTLIRSPYVAVDGDWTGYEARLGRKRRNELARQRRRLEGKGQLSFEVLDGRDDLDPLLEEGFRLEAAGWKGERGTAILSSQSTLLFYTDVAGWAAERGWLRLAFLRLDGRAIAFDLCLQEGGAWYLLKRGFDPELRRYAPGMLITHESIARAFSTGLTSYELLGDAEAYKLAWADRVRERVVLHAFAPTPGGRLTHAAYAYGRPAAKRALAALARARSGRTGS